MKVFKHFVPDSEGNGGIVSAKFSHDGALLVTRDLLGSIDIRDADTYKIRILDSLEGGVSSFEAASYGPYISHDSRYLLTLREQRPRLWDLEARIDLGTFPSEEGLPPEGFADAGGLRLVTALGDYALAWNLDMDEWPAIACRAAGRNLTQAEWDQFGPKGEPYHATCPNYPAGA